MLGIHCDTGPGHMCTDQLQQMKVKWNEMKSTENSRVPSSLLTFIGKKVTIKNTSSPNNI
jgi:hypothetical protein